MDLTTLRLIYVRRVVSTLAGALGPRGAMAFARWLARGVFDLGIPARRRAEQNLARAYGDVLSAEARDRLIGETFENIAAFWVEVLLARRMLSDRSWRARVALEDEALVQTLARSPRGALLVTGYFGNLAVCAYVLAQFCRPLHVIIDQARHPVLRSWQDELYRQSNIHLVPRQTALTRMVELASAGEKVFVVGERARPRGRAVPVPFLGGNRLCYPTIGSLARWCDVPVYVATARRTGWDYRFVVSCELAADPRDVPANRRPTDWVTRQYMARLEARIRQSPAQYLWTTAWDASRLA